jgi:hypothetical protein
MKNPTIKRGENISWVMITDQKTLEILFVVYLNTIFCSLGSALQYQTCKAGPIYIAPTMNLFKLSTTLKLFFFYITAIINSKNYIFGKQHLQEKKEILKSEVLL